MRDTYSLYEAKAKLSAIIREVRQGRRIVVTVRGQAVAEIRPLTPPSVGLEARLDDLAERGILLRADAVAKPPKVIERKAGALERFLADRHK